MMSSVRKAFGLFPLWPLLCGVLAGVVVADQQLAHGWWSLALGLAVICLIIRKPWCYLLAAGAVLGLFCHLSTLQKQRDVVNLLYKPTVAFNTKAEVVVLDTGSQQDGPYLSKVTSSETLPIGSRVLVSMPPRMGLLLEHGDVVNISGKLEKIGPVRNPHGFDRQKWLYRQGASAVLIPHLEPQIVGNSWSRYPLKVMADWRQKIRTSLTKGLPTEGGEATLIRAVFLGERPPRTSAMIQDFRESGTLHVFAVSGLHVGMVGAIIAAGLWFLRMPRWMMITSVIIGMAIYAGITGMRPPAVRAVVMATIFLSGFLVQRKPSLVNSLAASAIVVILYDGHQLFTPGFQLSYGVLLAIALAAGFWTRIFKPMGEIDPFMPRSLLTPWQEFWLEKRQWLRGSLAVSSAAWMGSAPLMWVHFGIITPIAILAGIPLMLLVFFILALAMLSLALGSMWEPAGVAVNHVNAVLARATYTAAAGFADVPGGHYYRRQEDDGKTRIIVFDLPYGGGSQYLDAGGGLLLDCGRSNSFQRNVMPALSAIRAQPDSLIITHADSKHSGAAGQVLEFFPIKQSLIPLRKVRSPSYRDFVVQATDQGCNLIVPQVGQKFEIEPGVHLETLYTPSNTNGKGRADDNGIVMMLHAHGWRILFTGDAGFVTEAALLSSDINLQADVIVMGRNRNDFTGSLAFYQAIKPKVVISTNAYFPDFERISEGWLNCVQSVGAQVLDQRKSGAVTITIDNNNLLLTPTIPDQSVITLTK